MAGGNSGSTTPPPPPTNESVNMFDRYLNVMNERIENKRKSEKVLERTKIYDKSLLINEEFSKMINSSVTSILVGLAPCFGACTFICLSFLIVKLM